MRLTDYLGEGGVWLHINADHHVMALIDKGAPHFHHLAFDLVDFGQMRVALDHLARHGRWLGWGPTRHGVGGNIASYVRIVEEECFVELYVDMEQIDIDHEPRALARRPVLVEHLGPAAAALLLPLRRGGDRVRAREPRDPGRPARAMPSPPDGRGARHVAEGLHDSADGRRSRESRAAAPVALRRQLPRGRLLGGPGRGRRAAARRASSRTRTPAAARPSWPSGRASPSRATS